MFILVDAYLGFGDCLDKFAYWSEGHSEQGAVRIFNHAFGIDNENTSPRYTQ
jgi:hypothetical protein